MIKKLLKNSLIQYILAIIAAKYIFLVRLTSKIEKVNYDIPQSFWNNNKPFILAFWHNQLMMISFTWSKNLKINIIASQHSDGRFGSIVGRFFKLRNIPFRHFVFNKNNEEELGTIFTFFVLETILLARLMNINPFDQPAVEQVKIETKKIFLR